MSREDVQKLFQRAQAQGMETSLNLTVEKGKMKSTLIITHNDQDTSEKNYFCNKRRSQKKEKTCGGDRGQHKQTQHKQTVILPFYSYLDLKNGCFWYVSSLMSLSRSTKKSSCLGAIYCKFTRHSLVSHKKEEWVWIHKTINSFLLLESRANSIRNL